MTKQRYLLVIVSFCIFISMFFQRQVYGEYTQHPPIEPPLTPQEEKALKEGLESGFKDISTEVNLLFRMYPSNRWEDGSQWNAWYQRVLDDPDKYLNLLSERIVFDSYDEAGDFLSNHTTLVKIGASSYVLAIFAHYGKRTDNYGKVARDTIYQAYKTHSDWIDNARKRIKQKQEEFHTTNQQEKENIKLQIQKLGNAISGLMIVRDWLIETLGNLGNPDLIDYCLSNFLEEGISTRIYFSRYLKAIGIKKPDLRGKIQKGLEEILKSKSIDEYSIKGINNTLEEFKKLMETEPKQDKPKDSSGQLESDDTDKKPKDK
ncbi:hypothetical protein HY772_03845 [Candidatus Woesearchaeota archaeon]|nr:hypothetical protein [Candidatus Woesearchaeota archaeon]